MSFIPACLREERILILGTTPLAERLIRDIESRPHCRRIVVGVLDDRAPAMDHFGGRPFLGPLCRLEAVIEQRRPQRIVVALTERRGDTPMRALLDAYLSRGVLVEDAATFCEHLTGQVAVESLTPMGIVCSGRFRPSRVNQAIARILSLFTAVVALAALSPLLALIAAAVKLDSPGPVLFTHKRVGANGRAFALLKFRTMRDGCARRSEWEADNRDHVTRVGRWLRASRLDELPQFVNILRGEMNLVGPRPHPVSNLALFTLVARNLSELTGMEVGCYRLRGVVRPGLTGWAQVRYRYANNLQEEIEKLRYDLYYVKHMSLWLDLRIILKTVAVLFRGSGAAQPAIARIEAAAAPARPFGFQPKVSRTTGA